MKINEPKTAKKTIGSTPFSSLFSLDLQFRNIKLTKYWTCLAAILVFRWLMSWNIQNYHILTQIWVFGRALITLPNMCHPSRVNILMCFYVPFHIVIFRIVILGHCLLFFYDLCRKLVNFAKMAFDRSIFVWQMLFLENYLIFFYIYIYCLNRLFDWNTFFWHFSNVIKMKL